MPRLFPFLSLALALTVSGCDAVADAVPEYTGAEVTTVTLLTLPSGKPDGAAWDVSGAADPYVVVRDADGEVLYLGETVDNAPPSLYPLSWAVSGVAFGMDEEFWVEVYDDDVAEDDAVAAYRVTLSGVPGLVKPDALSLQGPNGQPLAEVAVRWQQR